ncbi:MAG: D-sedoheptulose 7-phosphate isomerase, partial [Parcubacteria group bacterium Athens0714_26]
GNGGSAATASHFVNDLSKLTISEGRLRFKVVGLTDNVPILLAWANDTNYHNIFVEQIKNLIEPGDVVVGISGSGNSMNVINAIEYANERGGVTIGLVGYDGGKLINCVQHCIHIPISEMEKIEDMHLLIQHLLSTLIKKETELMDLQG